MAPRLPSIVKPPLGFAHRGARAHAPDNTIESFQLALRLGAMGLESDVWLTADGIPVLDHDGVVGPRLRRRPIVATRRSQLPSHVPTLEELYDTCGTAFDLSLDLKDPEAAVTVLAVARAAGGSEAVGRLWLCFSDWRTAAACRSLDAEVHLVESTRLRRLRDGAERHAARLADAGIDAINLHHSDWTGGLTTLFHRFRLAALAWDAQFERIIDELFDMGIDGVYSDHVDRLVTSLQKLEE